MTASILIYDTQIKFKVAPMNRYPDPFSKQQNLSIGAARESFGRRVYPPTPVCV